MAYRTWGRVLLAALGVGLLAGAGQLGFAYGLGVVRFARDFEQLSGQWTAHLAWVAWFAMLAAVAGGLAGNWLIRRDGLPETVGSRVAVSVAGGVGALAVAPLAMLPARVATVASGDAVTIAGLSAALGALVGVFAAAAVLSLRVAGLNLGAVTVVVWVVALLSVAPSLAPEDPLPEVRLGVLDATWLGAGLAQRLAVIVMPALALAVGAGIGALARWRGLPLIPVAVSGVVGPALLALAYLIAGPGDGSDRYQAAPYWGALIAVAAGGLGSVLAAVARQLTSGDRDTAGPPPRHGDHTAEVFPGYTGGTTEVTTGGDEGHTESFDAFGGGRDPGPGPTSALSGGSADRDGDTFGAGSGSEPGPRRARDLGDVERSTPRATSGSLFSSPTPVAPPRQPEIVSPPPGPEPTPVRPFDRQPAPGPGDWRTDKTSTFNSASVPVVPAPAHQQRDDNDLHQRPTSIRPQPATPSRAPRQAGPGEGGLGPIDLPGQQGGSGSAGLSWSERPGATARRDTSATPAGSGEMPDWRLAPPAWTPPPHVPPGEPATSPGADDAPAAEAAPAKERKRRGLFRRKEKPAPDTDWVDVPTSPEPAGFRSDAGIEADTRSRSSVEPDAGSRRDADSGSRSGAGSGPDQGERESPAATGPRGFGFGDLVSSRFGGDDRDDSSAGTSGRHGHDDDSDRRSWSSRAGDEPTADQPRSGRKASRAERHLRSVDASDGDWDIDDPAPAPADDPQGDEPGDDESRSAPSRGLFRRKGNNSESTETRLEPAAADKTEPRRRGKSDKPIGERDEDYVDWVTGLGAPEPVNERRRDETPRRSLRSTTRQED
ncbi:hypothetical protein [Asanoa iriomotensis]|nr:hypothetical protein [Asanoa iriomotensis]